ncbi:MAG: SDR family oxidoreductase [Armatimonadetes bacterium]|nr:SDR family oxidoreductase [Armatimonadota bacterium]
MRPGTSGHHGGGGEHRFRDKAVIVTGAASGYGLGTVKRFASEGAEVWATGRSADRLESALGWTPRVHRYPADVRDPEAWERLVEEVLSTAKTIDVLVNNAGAGVAIKELEDQTPEEIAESVSINLTGAILGCRAVVPAMKRQRGGTIVNVLSICAREAWPGWSVYSAAKAGLQQFGNCLYTEVRKSGIRVTSLIPSWGDTDFATAAGVDGPPDELLRRATSPEQFGHLVADLCALPGNLAMLDCTLLPMVQEIEPL